MFFIFGCLSFSGPEGLRNSWNVAGPVSSDGFFPIICVFNLGVAFQLREPNFSPSSSLLFLASYHVGAPVSLSLFLQFQVSSWVKGKALDGSGRFKLFFFFFPRSGPTVVIVSGPETIFTAALSGLHANKAGIDPPNEPTQQSLLLDLYLLKLGEGKSSTFSTFPGICWLIDCFAELSVYSRILELENVRTCECIFFTRKIKSGLCFLWLKG